MGTSKNQAAAESPRVLAQSDLIDAEMARVLRQKTPAERLEIGFGLWRHAQRLLRAHLRSVEPDWSDDKLDIEVARRLADGSW